MPRITHACPRKQPEARDHSRPVSIGFAVALYFDSTDA
jgi:hypothetical protein